MEILPGPPDRSPFFPCALYFLSELHKTDNPIFHVITKYVKIYTIILNQAMEQEDKMDKQNAILTVVGKDHTGILAAAATEAAKANGNIEDVSQSVLNGFFSMVMVIDVSALDGTLNDLQSAVQKALPDMEIHLMHENIFKAMHTI
jgi:ACT domain-containing protein